MKAFLLAASLIAASCGVVVPEGVTAAEAIARADSIAFRAARSETTPPEAPDRTAGGAAGAVAGRVADGASGFMASGSVAGSMAAGAANQAGGSTAATVASVPPASVPPASVPPASVPSGAANQAGGSTAATVASVPSGAAPLPAASEAGSAVRSPGPSHVAESSFAMPPDARSLDRVDRRRLRAERFAARIDSLVLSRNFLFLPNSMQEVPGGEEQIVYADFYYLGVQPDHVEVHLPVVRGGVLHYFEVLNFDTFDVQHYQASRVPCGWNVSFTIRSNEAVYALNLAVSTTTGATLLTLLGSGQTTRYIGLLRCP